MKNKILSQNHLSNDFYLAKISLKIATQEFSKLKTRKMGKKPRNQAKRPLLISLKCLGDAFVTLEKKGGYCFSDPGPLSQHLVCKRPNLSFCDAR